jgi:hypothetical protein
MKSIKLSKLPLTLVKSTVLVIIIWLLFILIINTKGYPNEVFKIGSSRTIVFLDSEESCKYLSDDEHLSNLSKLDIELRLERLYSDNDSVIYKKEYFEHWSRQFRNWSRLDKIFLIRHLKKVYSKINSITPIVLPDTLYLIRTTGKQEFDAFYTHKKAIICPYTIRLASTYLPIFSKKIEKTLTHELFHVYTNNNVDIIDSLYKIVGFEKIDSIKLDKRISERIINNPDDKPGFYKIMLKDALTNEDKYYCMLILSKYNHWKGYIEFPGHISVLLVYLDTQKLHQIDLVGTKWVSSLDQIQNPIVKGKEALTDYKKKVGLTGEVSPEEIIAHLFIDLIYSKFDKELLLGKSQEYIDLLNGLENILKV